MTQRLLVTATLPPWPVLDGLSLRLAAKLEVLVEQWDVTLVAPRVPDSVAPPGVRWYPWEPTNPTRPWQFFPWNFDSTPLREAIANACRDFPPVVGLAYFGSEDCWPADGPPAVHDRVDCSTLTAWRYLGLGNGLRDNASKLHDVVKFARYEANLGRRFHSITVVGDDDARWLRRLARGSAVHVIPNGVSASAAPASPQPVSDPLVVFTGNMAYQPNVDAAMHFAQAVWPLVRARVPGATFLIAGRHPTAAICTLDGQGGISVSGAVEDMAATIAQAKVAVAPMRCGAGVKNKVLEAWAVGVPVVMSSIARNGLTLPPGAARLVHDDDEGFSECLAALLEDGPRRDRLGAEAREHVQRHYTWRQMAERMSVLLQEAAPGGTTGAGWRTA